MQGATIGNGQNTMPPPRRRLPRRRSRWVPCLIVTLLGAFFAFFLGVVFLFVVFSNPGPVKVSGRSVLYIALSGEISEHRPPGPWSLFLENRSFNLYDYTEMIRKAENDQKIEGIHLQIDPNTLEWAQLEDLREALLNFKRSGKWIVATGDLWQERDYFLACTANEIYMSEEASLVLDGFMARVSYYGDLLKKYGVGVHVEAIGEYKSMGDGLRQNKMSAYNRVEIEELLAEQERLFIETVAEARELEPETVKQILDKAVFDARTAKDLVLIDDLKYPDQVEERISELLGGVYRPVASEEYWRPKSETTWQDSVAVIYAVGSINVGPSGEGLFGDSVVGSSGVIEDLRAARSNDRVKAIVIRIDSPGGSVLASDLIWREIRETAELGIPVIASMGAMAASGGYYLAVACDEIVAQPTTLTGSIGIVVMRMDFEKLYRDWLVNVEVIKTSPSADIFDDARMLTKSEIEELTTRTAVSYRAFVTKAAEGRDLSFDELDSVARGRVWSGTHALDHQLVDSLGSLNHAIHIAAEKADLTNYQIIRYPREIANWRLFGDSELPVSQTKMINHIKRFIPYELRFLHNVSDRRARFDFLAISPYHIKID